MKVSTPEHRDRPTVRSNLQVEIARSIVERAYEEGWPQGHHLVEQDIAGSFGCSRSPVRRALDLLARQGLVVHEPNRGYFLARSAEALVFEREALPASERDDLYDQIARDWFNGELGDQVTEADLRRRYSHGRARLSAALRRLVEDGLVLSGAGGMWYLAPSLSTESAFLESYSFRRAIEPAAILEPGYRLDPIVARRVRQRHDAILNNVPGTNRLQVLVDADVQFHEMISAGSGNQYFLQAIQRQNALRRLAEQQATLEAGRLYESCREHLAILDAIETDDYPEAARLMREHLTISSAFRPDFRQ